MGKYNTDYGNIYSSSPGEIFIPESITELQSILKKLNKNKQKYVVRGAGHSTNGQTVTSEKLILTDKLNRVEADYSEMTVLAEGGSSWDEILKSINFPQYCVPVFPLNPLQKIKAGGSISVGGIGPYSLKDGGLWNMLEEIELITPEGELIKCNSKSNEEIFKFVPGSFGTLGVIARVRMKITKSWDKISKYKLEYDDINKVLPDLELLCKMDGVNGLYLQSNLINNSFNLFVISEVRDQQDIVTRLNRFSARNMQTYTNFDEKGISFAHGIVETKINKYGLIYMPQYAVMLNEMPNIIKPWMDVIVPMEKYIDFVEGGRAKIMEVFGNGANKLMPNAQMFTSYIIKNMHKNFPLSLDLSGVEYAVSFNWAPMLPPAMLSYAKEFIFKIEDFAYELGGKVYLYGINEINKEKFVKQAGSDELSNEFINLKSKLDQNKLLNNNVFNDLFE